MIIYFVFNSVGETIKGLNGSTKLKYQGCSLDDEDDWQQFRNCKIFFPFLFHHLIKSLDCNKLKMIGKNSTAVRASIRETPSSTAGHSISPSPRLSQLQPGSFSFSGTTSHRKESGLFFSFFSLYCSYSALLHQSLRIIIIDLI